MSFGRLERSPGPQPMSEINVTPLVDVMLVLVVIFILTAPLLASSIRLDLPRSDAARPADAPKFVTLVLDRQGAAFLNDQPVTREQLAGRLAAAAQASPDTEVQLRADRAVPYGQVLAVIGLAQKAGLNRIGFVADPTAEPAAAGAAAAGPQAAPATAAAR
ncbi:MULTISPECIES: biopolymer transporter ExbD [Ramlibacter]|uniref:Biopolymer transporter ExbD n=1 Tax=Ramlibacter aquaticus TaxID=2780094 RepID=A0ABR9SFB3_9BURK|nr:MULTISPECIES: biopolymer transporter ExbD [Ramlibacter]MBE7940442.1 biopolymer transporter ExbD [Ramlibacter aquaticus]